MALESSHFLLEHSAKFTLLRLQSEDGANLLTRACVLDLTDVVRQLALSPRPLILAGNRKFFSAGANISEIAALTGPAAYEFSKMGQTLMDAVEQFPAPIYAVIEGYCMGGGLDLALACHHRIASPHAIFAHGGAALGLVTGWGGTQRLPRLIGKDRALALLVSADKLHATEALRIGLVEAVVEDPVAEEMTRLSMSRSL